MPHLKFRKKVRKPSEQKDSKSPPDILFSYLQCVKKCAIIMTHKGKIIYCKIRKLCEELLFTMLAHSRESRKCFFANILNTSTDIIILM